MHCSVEDEGRELVERLGGRWTPAGGMCRCPAHEDRTPSLSVRPGRTRLLLHCFAGCSGFDVLRVLQAKRLLGTGDTSTRPHCHRLSSDRMRSAALRIWNESQPVAGTPAERYLASRGLHTESAHLRFNPRTPHGRGPLVSFRPAMIAAVREGCGLVAINRTFLDSGLKEAAAGRKARAGLGAYGGGAVRLQPCASRLGLAEGIETALSATQLFGIPCWAALGTGRFATMRLPDEVEELVLFLDNDPAGRRAEAIARTAFGDRLAVEARYPPREGDDWNDVLLG